MAITLLQKRKIERYLILVFAAVLIISIIVLWFGFRKKGLPVTEAPVKPQREIKINFEVLDGLLLKGLEPFERIKPFEESKPPGEKVGRENPFSAF